MSSESIIYLNTEVGDLGLEFEGNKLISLSISDKSDKIGCVPTNIESNETVKRQIFLQLKSYFSRPIEFQDMPLAPQGTSFQQSVWQELSKIPQGETRTYGEIANKLKSSARAVGNACRRNPIPIIIPCHRVISAKGIGGYLGKTNGTQLNVKHWLLNHEGVSL